ncbi:hypothetical protein JCM11491_001148 [Sporobolomyces phaffii]
MTNSTEETMPGLEGGAAATERDDDEVIVMDQDDNPSSSKAAAFTPHVAASSSSRRSTRSGTAGGGRRGPATGGGASRGMSNFERERNEIERHGGARGGGSHRNEDARQGSEQNIWDKVLDKNGGYPGMHSEPHNGDQAPREDGPGTSEGGGFLEGRASDGFEGVREVIRGTCDADDAWSDIDEPAISYVTSSDEEDDDRVDDDGTPSTERPHAQYSTAPFAPTGDLGYLTSVVDPSLYHSRLDSGSTTNEPRSRDSDSSSFATDDNPSRATARTSSRLARLHGNVIFSEIASEPEAEESDPHGGNGGEEEEEDGRDGSHRRERHRDMATQALNGNLGTSTDVERLNSWDGPAPADAVAEQPSPSIPTSTPSTGSPTSSRDPFVSVANGPLAQLSANHLQEPRAATRGARSFFSNLLNRSPRSNNASPRFPATSNFLETTPDGGSIPSTPARSPALGAARDLDSRHNRSTSLPTSPTLSGTHGLSTDTSGTSSRTIETSPRISRTFAGIGRSVSLRTSPPGPTLAPNRAAISVAPPLPRAGSRTPVSPESLSGNPPRATPLERSGLSLVSITPQLRLSTQPLCGCVLDDKYLLIGTSTGLDFLPLPLPGSLPIHQLGKKKRKETRKPISLIKRTRFRQLIVLSERSNILLAIAGRSDQVRVYALEGIRLAIEKKMADVDIRDGFPYIQDTAVLVTRSKLPTSQERPTSTRSETGRTVPHTNPPPLDASSPPPTYASIEPSPSTRRRPPALQLASSSTVPGPASPSSLTFSRRGSLANGTIVREVPTVPRSATSSQGSALSQAPRPLRPQASREFSAMRRNSATATIRRRKSRVELHEGRKGKARSRNGSGQSSLYAPASTSRSTTTPADDSVATGGGPSKTGAKLQPRPVGRADTFDIDNEKNDLGRSVQSRSSDRAGAFTLSTDGNILDRFRTASDEFVGPRYWRHPVQRREDAHAETCEAMDDQRHELATQCWGSPSARDFSSPQYLSRVSLAGSAPDSTTNEQTSDRLEAAARRASTVARRERIPDDPPLKSRAPTYLAALCGDDGDRIELFTGSRNISLSLNRTFVLPERPRSIDLQLQGDDLVDIYLIYAQSIFALEPSTVRVREVGVGRSDRRRRGNATRTRTNADTTPPTPTVPGGENGPSEPGFESVLFRNVSDGPEGTRNASSLEGIDAPSTLADTSQTASSGSQQSPQEVQTATEGRPPLPAATDRAPTTSTVSAPGPSRPRKPLPTSPYSTFCQLPFVPALPSGLLSSSWIIPPTYSDVVARSPSPGIDLDPSVANSHKVGSDRDLSELPLLSPVSLLGGAALRNNGRPGLFFVSRGSSLTGIVTAEGKSILKKPMSWSESSPTDSSTDDVPQNIEVLVSSGRRTAVVKVSTSNVKAIEFEEGSTAPSVPAAITLTSTASASVQFLSTHHASQQLFFAQTCGAGSWTIQCLGARTAD